MVGKGATTIWELWNGDTADPAMNSGNHVMLVGDLVIWLYENLAGIKSDPAQPGFKHIIMKPTLVGGLKFVKATHRSPYGLISSEWRKDGTSSTGGWKFRQTRPRRFTCRFPMGHYPQDQRCRCGRGEPAPAPNGRRREVFEAGSGKYDFYTPGNEPRN